MSSALFSPRGEDGQSVVFVILFIAGLVLMLALVVDVGSWLRAQRQAQSAADAAALAGVQALPDQPAASSKASEYADQNWPGISSTPSFPDPTSIKVETERDVPGVFGHLLSGVFNIVTVHAQATARTQTPFTLNNDTLQDIAPDPTYVAPIVVNQDVCGAPPWGGDCLGVDKTLTLDEGSPRTSDFSLADLSCASSCQSPSSSELADWITCSDCYSGDITPPLNLRTIPDPVLDDCVSPLECTVGDALRSITGKPVLTTVFDRANPPHFHVVGFAALVITFVPPLWQGSMKQIRAHFVSFTPEPRLDKEANPTPCGQGCDFGVRAYGLVG